MLQRLVVIHFSLYTSHSVGLVCAPPKDSVSECIFRTKVFQIERVVGDMPDRER